MRCKDCDGAKRVINQETGIEEDCPHCHGNGVEPQDGPEPGGPGGGTGE